MEARNASGPAALRPMRPRRRLVWLIVAAVLAGIAGAWLGLTRCGGYAPPEPAYSGSSDGLKSTVVVPTLDTPMPAGKNVVWCASFQAAWNRLKADVFKAPVQIKGAEEICGRLNAAPQSEADLPPGGFYAAAGFTRDGIVEKIQDEMAERFPDVPSPDFGNAGGIGAVAYAYLAAEVRFAIPFCDSGEALRFAGSDGGTAPVTAFGVRRSDCGPFREQVAVLYASPFKGDPRETDQFAIDPCKGSLPSQIILARIAPGDTLAGTLAALDAKIAGGSEDGRRFGPNDVLLVPNMRFDLAHRFKEIEGPPLSLAAQRIDFRLDRSGARLSSEAKLVVPSVARHFVFDRPFLIVMKKRGAAQPFFVMWVDNAKLLCKW